MCHCHRCRQGVFPGLQPECPPNRAPGPTDRSLGIRPADQTGQDGTAGGARSGPAQCGTGEPTFDQLLGAPPHDREAARLASGTVVGLPGGRRAELTRHTDESDSVTVMPPLGQGRHRPAPALGPDGWLGSAIRRLASARLVARPGRPAAGRVHRDAVLGIRHRGAAGDGAAQPPAARSGRAAPQPARSRGPGPTAYTGADGPAAGPRHSVTVQSVPVLAAALL
jgi:hypothetical protein